MILNNIEKRGQKLILISLIIIVIAIIIILLAFFYSKTKVVEKENGVESEILKIEGINTELFLKQTAEEINNYFNSNPDQKQKSSRLTTAIENCEETQAVFTGENKDMDGALYVTPSGNNCKITYYSEFIVDCDYKKEYLKTSLNSIKTKVPEESAGPIVYYFMYFDLSSRVFAEELKQEIKRTFNASNLPGKLTLGESILQEKIEYKLTNPQTNEIEITKCNVY